MPITHDGVAQSAKPRTSSYSNSTHYFLQL